MKRIVPDYYSRFSCLMGSCKHNCCIGWEIDVDENSLLRYRSVPGEFGEKLRQSIKYSSDAACFRLTSEKRCPFLQENGLCEMILRIGSDSLCQICADHPRFRNFFSDRMEIGLGLCCEAASRLILSHEEPVQLIELTPKNEEPEEPLSAAEKSLLALRAEMTAVVQDRNFSFRTRIIRLQKNYLPSMPDFNAVHWAQFLLTLERLDDLWGIELNRLTNFPERPSACLMEIPFEQLTVYLLYRHLPLALEDGDTAGRVAYVLLITELIYALAETHKSLSMETLVEIVRMYSAEIEYSDQNIDAVISELHALGV